MFIWTIKDAVGVAFLAIVAIWALCILVPIWWRRLWRRRKPEQASHNGATE